MECAFLLAVATQYLRRSSSGVHQVASTYHNGNQRYQILEVLENMGKNARVDVDELTHAVKGLMDQSQSMGW